MTHIATLVSSPQSPAIDLSVADDIARLLPNGRPGAWLAQGIAIDVSFSPAGLDALDREAMWSALRAFADRCRARIDALPIDVIVQKNDSYRRKKLFLADMDSTMIGQECIDELADFVGLKQHVAAITERAMRGEIAFEPALRERVALLAGLEDTIAAKVFDERITLTPGGPSLVRTMRAHGAHTALVSGGFTLFTQKVGEAIGFHEHRANLLVVEDGQFAGRVAEPILGREAKLAALLELRRQHNLVEAETLAVGDGANDLGMLAEAGLGVAYHAKPAVAAAAHGRIDHADLTALLFAQGYRRDEFVE
ncbi:MAG TPA: phosphoserine phosphatase SerB [Beijerinckiaceae bacterium]|nr:phosphoserine phosphatase SerB [Beijerinckiaceae bacterium]